MIHLMRLLLVAWPLITGFIPGAVLFADAPVVQTIQIGTGDGKTITFGPNFLYNFDPKLMDYELQKGSVFFKAGPLILDDKTGGGKFANPDGSVGGLNYDTGLFFVHFRVAPASGTPIQVNYQYGAEKNPRKESGTRDLDASEITIASEREGLPADKMGKFPIAMPTYKGVEQLLVLSNRWVIVVTSNLEDVSKEIQKLVAKDPAFGGFNFLEGQVAWKESQIKGNWNWDLFRNKIEPAVNKYLAEARENAGERKLDDPAYFSITSPDDTRYSRAQTPTRVTRFMVSMGGERVTGIDPDYAHDSYLEMPIPLENGKHYTITLGNGKAVSFLYDERRTVSRSLKVNQVGYLPDAPHKYAYLSNYLQDFGPMDFSYAKTFNVVNVNTGNIALSGDIKLRAANPTFSHSSVLMSGEDIYELDLTGLTKPGTYFISVPGVGRSWPFKVGNDIYGDAFYTAMRGLFAQRCGIALTKEYSAWTRMQCHTDPTYENEYVEGGPFIPDPSGGDYDIFNVIGATTSSAPTLPNGAGGWHDASDWDKSISHYTNVFGLLTAFELNPQKFREYQLHLPESGNGIPDILNEAEYGLLLWKKSMTPEGGVASRWETWTHPGIDDHNVKYSFARKTRWGSLMFAAAAAQYAYLVKPFNAEKAAEYEKLAKKAYAFGTNPANSLGTVTIHARTDRGKGTPYTLTWTEKDEYSYPYLIGAKLRLFILTGDKSYLDKVVDYLGQVPHLMVWPYNYSDFMAYLYFPLFQPSVRAALPWSVINSWEKQYTKIAYELASWSVKDPYRRAKDPANRSQMAWGWGVMTNRAKWLLLGYWLTKDPTLKEKALYNVDYQLGTNPQGMVWTTGMGYVYPIHIQHEISENEGILDPFPGIAIYGPTDNGWRMVNNIWEVKDSSGKMHRFLKPDLWDNEDSVKDPILRRYMSHAHFITDQNEFTVHETMDAGIFSYAFLMNDDYMPNDAIKNRLPRDDQLLFGRWYLP